MPTSPIGINGFGRIGRTTFRALLERGVAPAAINDVADAETLRALVLRDSHFGRFPGAVRPLADGVWEVEHPGLTAPARVRVGAAARPEDCRWGEAGVALVLECSGRFRRRAAAARHLDAGASRVVISAPSPDADVDVAFGVNHEHFDPERHVVLTGASCTTNSLAAPMAVLEAAFGIEGAMMTTVHAMSRDQPLLDSPHRDLRRGRAGPRNLVPTTTGAAEATAAVVPSLAGRFVGMGVRVPVPVVSLSMITLQPRAPVGAAEALDALRAAATGRYAGVLAVSDHPLVSSDVIGRSESAIVDAGATLASGPLLQLAVWYDNESGFSHRLAQLALAIAHADARPDPAERGADT